MSRRSGAEGIDRTASSRTSPSGLRTVALVLTATALPVISLIWASGVARTEVEQRARAGLAATARATVLQEQQAWDDALRVVMSAASRPVPLSALELRDTTLATQGVQNILVTGPFADVRLYSASGDLVAMAALPGVTPTPAAGLASGPPTVGGPLSVGSVIGRQVSVAAGNGGGRLVVDVDMTQLLGKPSGLGFGRTGAKFLVTRQGMIVAGSAGVGSPLRAPVNLDIAAAGKPVTKITFSPFFGRLTVESYEPVPDQDTGILVQQARSEVMAGADRLSALLRWVALALGVLGMAVAAVLGVVLARRSRRLAASEERLVESETRSRRRLEQFLDAMPIGVVVAAPDGRASYANREAARLLGADCVARYGAEGLGEAEPVLLTGTGADGLLLARALSGETTHAHDMEVGKPGARVPVEVWARPVLAGDGTVEFGIAAFADVSLRRSAEEAQGRLVSIVHASRDAIVSKDLDGTVTTWNRGAELLFGYTAGEIVGGSIDVLVPEDRKTEERELRERVASGLGAEQRETIRLRKDGTPIAVSRTMSPIEDPTGAITGMASIYRDVTERNRAEAKFQGLLESAPDAIVVVGPDGLIRIVNRQTELMFGYSRDELLGQPVERLIPDRFARRHPTLRAGFLANASARAMGANLELAARRRDGSEFPVDISLAPLQTEEGILVSAAVRDVTERKRAQAALLEREAELALARDQALEASRLKSDFLANMSHEIRTPMNAVIGLTGLLLDSNLDAEQREYAAAVRSAGESLLEIINDLLDFSKIEAGKLRLEVMDFELRRIVEEVVDLLGAAAHDKELALTTDVHPDVPAFVRGDPGRLRQILTNLVGNAIKFSDHGRVAVRVTVVPGTPDAASLRFDVTDTGIGIAPEAQRQLFQAFEQVDSSASRRHGGTGLGLAISKQLAEMMGGRIGLDSTLGAGSTFWFSIPLVAADAPEPAAVASRDPMEHRRHDGARILVAEDNPVNQLVAVRILEKLGYRADVAANGSEAVDALMRIDYAAVLMDCQMPEMDGFEATREIRRRQGGLRRTPVIAMTAAAAREDRERCVEADMDDYVSKPVRTEELGRVLAEWLPADAPPDDGSPSREYLSRAATAGEPGTTT
jgi:PAS domain S-box-containing protein